MSSAICLNKIIKEDEQDIAPQMKRMKLNTTLNPDIEIKMSNYISSDPYENLKTAFPSISENMIKEILEKSENNIEGAKKLISEFKQSKINENINLHQTNRKRKYENAFNNLTFNNLISQNNNKIQNNNNNAPIERKIIKFNNKIYPLNNSNLNFPSSSPFNIISNSNNNNISLNSVNNTNIFPNNFTQYETNTNFNICTENLINDSLVENLICEVSKISSKEEIKLYLINKITEIISKFFLI